MHTPHVSHFSHVFSMDPSNQLISGWLVAALDLTSALGFRSIAAAARGVPAVGTRLPGARVARGKGEENDPRTQRAQGS